MRAPHIPPKRSLKAFNCPICGAYSVQIWSRLGASDGVEIRVDPHVATSYCLQCNGTLYWFDERIIEPAVSVAEPPGPDLPERVAAIYREAAAVAPYSARAAVALLRLAVQLLCRELSKKTNLDDAIAELVAAGLPVRVQQALDVVRVIGNNAVHPGEIDVSDDQDTAAALFGLVNSIAYELITRPRELEGMYGRLPESIRLRIEKRDA